MNVPVPPSMPAVPAVAKSAPRVAPAGFSMPTKSHRGVAIVINAVEGWGKTTLLANAPNASIIMAPREAGYQTLFDRGLVPAIPSASVSTWEQLLVTVDSVTADTKVLGLDAAGGFERLCHQFVCDRDYKGVWGSKGFDNYKEGYDVSVGDWLILLSKLEDLQVKGVNIIMLSHARIVPFQNPAGPDYSRFEADMHKKTWGVTHKWADAVLFGRFFSVVETRAGGKDAEVLKKGKGVGGDTRVLYTQRRDAWDAKNRFGLDECIDIPSDRNQSWAEFARHVFKKES